MRMPTLTGLRNRLVDQLLHTLAPAESRLLMRHARAIVEPAARCLMTDLAAYVERDPAARGRPDVILKACPSFQAVLHHRLAHTVWYLRGWLHGHRQIIAHKLAGAGRALSGAEIHPAARIGERFILDHGVGTVIGETCRIGSDCYVLGGVTLGAFGISDNPDGKRHPTLGNHVEVGAGVRVLGPVTIGDNVFIGPYCVVTHDIPSDSRVTIVNQLQVERATSSPSALRVHAAFATDGRLHVVGERLQCAEALVVDACHGPLTTATLVSTVRSATHLEFRLDRVADDSGPAAVLPLHVRISDSHRRITVLKPPGLEALVRQVLGPRPVDHVLLQGRRA